jgi:hypothetical protein
MALQPRPELALVVEYGGVGGGALGAQSALTDAPDSSGGKASLIRIVDITTGAVLQITFANGVTSLLTVAHQQDIWAEFVSIGAATTCDCVQFGWV